jgi:hypothetical protein
MFAISNDENHKSSFPCQKRRIIETSIETHATDDYEQGAGTDTRTWKMTWSDKKPLHDMGVSPPPNALQESSNRPMDFCDSNFCDLFNLDLPPPPDTAFTAVSSMQVDAIDKYEPVRRIPLAIAALRPPRHYPAIRWGKFARALCRREREMTFAFVRLAK